MSSSSVPLRPASRQDALPPSVPPANLASQSRKRACTECHRAKAACSGSPSESDPCTRCVRLGKTCVTDERKKRRRRGAPTDPPAKAAARGCDAGVHDALASAGTLTDAAYAEDEPRFEQPEFVDTFLRDFDHAELDLMLSALDR